MCSEGPAVSFSGSPNVSPVTAASWVFVPFPPSSPLSMYFFELSKAPPALNIKVASNAPMIVAESKKAARGHIPRVNPTTMGENSPSKVGAIICFREFRVLTSTHLA